MRAHPLCKSDSWFNSWHQVGASITCARLPKLGRQVAGSDCDSTGYTCWRHTTAVLSTVAGCHHHWDPHDICQVLDCILHWLGPLAGRHPQGEGHHCWLDSILGHPVQACNVQCSSARETRSNLRYEGIAVWVCSMFANR
jgi:hypothetical protein